MLFGAKGGCQQCSCVPCDACTRTCTEPHTGTAFQTVYHIYGLGEEIGNPSDGYLSASGDVDTSDPYDGMDGFGPWYQEVSGSFTISSATTRFPCAVVVSFWRNSFPLGPVGVPPPPSSLTLNRIRVSVSALSETGVYAGGQLIEPGGSYDFSDAIPSVTGSGDQSGGDPHSGIGSISVSAECGNKIALFTISGRVEWNTKKRQHVVYGKVRECYEEGSPCGTACSGSAPPSTLYVTISNYTSDFRDYLGLPVSGSDVNGTYVVERVPYNCDSWIAKVGTRCTVTGTQVLSINFSQPGLLVAINYENSMCIFPLLLIVNPADITAPICGSTYSSSGTSTVIRHYLTPTITGSFDWKIEA